MKKKSILIACVACLLVAVISVGATMAYLTDTSSATNKITIGNVTIEVVEDDWNTSSTYDMEPGATHAKDPRVENTGLNPAWIRAQIVSPTFTDKAGNTQNLFTITGTTSNWGTKQADGYYYYNAIVPAKAAGATSNPTTTDLFTQIQVNPAYEEGMAIQTATDANGKQLTTIVINAQGIQTTGLTGNPTTCQAAFAALLASNPSALG